MIVQVLLWILLLSRVGTAVALRREDARRDPGAQQEAGHQDQGDQLRRAPAALLHRLF